GGMMSLYKTRTDYLRVRIYRFLFEAMGLDHSDGSVTIFTLRISNHAEFEPIWQWCAIGIIKEYPNEIERNKILNPISTDNNSQESESEQDYRNENNSNKRARLTDPDQLGLNITLDGYFQKPLSSKQKEKLKQLLLKATISCGWAFSWVDNPEIKELFYYLNPAIKLPNRKTLSGRILTKTAITSMKLQKKDIQTDKLGVTLTYDSWKNVKKESLLGIALINSKGKTLI
ncbi:4044_t:CDS:2, partial [Dentiscutata erythropus]